MSVQTAADIEALLDANLDPQLVGIPEQDWLDFKEQPYVMGSSKHRWELAKDVANMASNAQGGCILLGLATKKDPEDFEEVASEVKPFPCDLIDEQKYRDVIDSYAYPPVHGLKIRQYRRNGGCIGLIIVPPQSEDDRPFLLKRVVDTEGGSVDAFALPTRDGSHTRWTPVGQVHRDVADGRRSRRPIDPAIYIPPGSIDRPAPIGPKLRERVEDIERYMDWSDAAIYALAAAPTNPPDRIVDLYAGPVYNAFIDPPQIRHAGFGIGWRQEPSIEGGSLVAADSDFRFRRLDPDGFFVVAVKAEEDFLGRVGPRPTGVPRAMRINTTVLVEFTYEFCRFQAMTLGPAIESRWTLALHVLGAQSRPWRLALGPRNAHFDLDFREASSDDWLKEIEAASDPESDGFELLARFYDLFGVSDTLIPFSEDRRIQPDEIINPRR